MVEVIRLARRGSINPKITKRYPLDGADVAVADLHTRKISGRAVINP